MPQFFPAVSISADLSDQTAVPGEGTRALFLRRLPIATRLGLLLCGLLRLVRCTLAVVEVVYLGWAPRACALPNLQDFPDALVRP